MTNLKALLAASAIAAGVGFSTSASAVFINTWTATFNNGFSEDATVFDNRLADDEKGFADANEVDGDGTTNEWLRIEWGQASKTVGIKKNSALEVSAGIYTGGDSVNVQTNGATMDTIGITHFNRVIGCRAVSDINAPDLPDGEICPALQTTTLLSTLTLEAIDPPLGVLGSVTETFGIKFVETQNDALCPVGSPLCDDIFILLDPIALTFDIDVLGTIHTVTISAELLGNPLAPLDDAACAAAGLGSGCIGFTTDENSENTVIANIKITAAQEAPEPGTLAMLGALLVAGGVATRRKRV